MKEKYDQIELYCPKLGHHLTFKYCRSENQGVPCSRVVKCCSDKIPVDEYIRDNLSTEETQVVFQEPQPKMNSILSILQRVNNRAS